MNQPVNTCTIDDIPSLHPSLDGTYLLEFYDSDIEDILWAMKTFYDFTLKDFNKLLPLAIIQDWQAVKKIAHKMKPNFKMAGLTFFFEDLYQIERMDAEDADQCQQSLLKIKNLDEEMRATYIPIIEAEIQKLGDFLKE